MLGHDVVADYAAARRRIGVVPQELVFDPFFSVREALRIQSGYFGVHDNDAWIDELLANLGLADKADANMRQLSGGMKRRVLVAQALVHRPPVIVLDEPTAGVDVELRQTLWQFVARLNKEGHTVLLTTHYLEEAEALCGRIAMLKQGRVVALDRTSALLAGTASTMLRFKLDKPLPPALATERARHRPHRADHGARRARGRIDPGRAARRRLRAGRPRDRPRRPRGRVHRDHARRVAAAGGGMSALPMLPPEGQGRDRRPRRHAARCSTRKCCASGR